MSNHVAFTDWAVFFILASACGFVDRIRFIWKRAGQYLPGAGWAAYFAEYLFVRRQASDIDSLTGYVDSFVKSRSPLVLAFFPEGTFIDGDNLEYVTENKEFAKGRDLPEMSHVLVPRTKGFVVMMDAFKNVEDAVVVDLTLAYASFRRQKEEFNYLSTLPLVETTKSRKLPGLIDMLSSSTAPEEIHVHCSITRCKDVPDGQSSAWLLQRFKEKEHLLSYFTENRIFPSPLYPEFKSSEITYFEQFILILWAAFFLGFAYMVSLTPDWLYYTVCGFFGIIVAGSITFVCFAY